MSSVNAIERNSKPMRSRLGPFVERICKGAFDNAIKRNDDIHVLLNHDWGRDLGSTKKGNLDLEVDSIGLKARAIINDPGVMKAARNGDLVGWSFSFTDREVERGNVDGMPTRAIKELDLYEVSILDRSRSPAYEGTLITVRSESGEVQYRGEEFIDEVVFCDSQPQKETPKEETQSGDERCEPDELKKELSKEYFTGLWSQIKLMEES